MPASDSNTNFDILILLSGCPRACAVKKELTSRAGQTISVASESIDGIVIPEISIPSVIEKELCKGVFTQRVNANFDCPPQG